MYVITCGGDKYVARPGLEHSYTKRLEEARTFYTLEAAHRECCPGNERVVKVTSLLQPPE